MTAKTPFSPLPAHTPGRDLPEAAQRRFQADYGSGQAPDVHSVYQTEDATLRPPSQKTTHWSIAWSDLMMTMFILFLSLFVYQAAHKDFLISDEHQVVAGDTREAFENGGDGATSFPFAPATPAAPLITSGTVKKVEPITLQEINLDEAFSDADMDKTIDELARVIPSAGALRTKNQPARPAPEASPPPQMPRAQQEAVVSQAKNPESDGDVASPAPPPPKAPQRIAGSTLPAQPKQSPAVEMFAHTEKSTGSSESPHVASGTGPVAPELTESVIQPQPLDLEREEEPGSVNEIFSRSRKTLDAHNLDQFASINLVPDKAVHIVLTGDLLFETGHAALSQQAIDSLEKIAEVIQQTRHTVHIEGHTDDVPIFAGRYANNWELSIARANAVANFLIEDMGMEPQQFVISGFSSYKPVAPNTTAPNRAANRRVEIVIAQPQERQDIAFRETTNRAFPTL